MSNILSIFSKDTKSYFFSMIAYAVIATFLVLSGFFFSSAVSYFSFYSFQLSAQPYLSAQGLNLTEAVIGNLFFNFSVVLLLMIPILTMRTLAEEQKQGTFELLLTYPVNEFQVVLGKFLAAFFVFTVMIAPTFLYLLILRKVGGDFEWGVVLSGFLGQVLLGVAFISFGVFASSLSENQLISAVLTFGFLLLLWIIAWLAEFLPPDASRWINGFSLTRHAEDFFKGIIELKHLVFYLLFTIFFLFLTVWRLQTRKWVR